MQPPRLGSVQRAPVRPSTVWIGIFVLLAVAANCTWWAHEVAFDGAPDEADHYAVVDFVGRHGRLPRYGEESFTVQLMNSMTRERYPVLPDARALVALAAMNQRFELRLTYLFTPQMPYWANGWFCRVLGGATPAKARGFDALCIGVAALCAYVTGLLLWQGRRWPASVAGLAVGLWPQMTFVGAYVNDDAFAIAAVALLLLACVWCECGAFDRRRAAVFGISLGIVGSAKPYVLAILPLLVVWLVWRVHRQAGDQRRVMRHVALALGIAAVLAGIWLARNAILYRGDPTGRRALSHLVSDYVQSLPPEVVARTRLLFLKPRHELLRANAGSWFEITFESFWARFGWMRIRMHRLMYAAAFVVVVSALLVSLVLRFVHAPGAARADEAGPGPVRGGPKLAAPLFALPYLVLLVLGSLANTWFMDYQPQGRYLLSCVPGLSLQMVAVTGANGRWRSLPALFLLAFFGVQSAVARLVYLR